MSNSERRAAVVGHAGQTIRLCAPGEGVGGYLWGAEIPPNVGKVVEEKIVPTAGAVGAGPEKIFVVRLDGVGTGLARLVLKRPWEATPTRIIEYPIHSR